MLASGCPSRNPPTATRLPLQRGKGSLPSPVAPENSQKLHDSCVNTHTCVYKSPIVTPHPVQFLSVFWGLGGGRQMWRE